ncbi:MAG: WD40 repeat domain-containing protein, partial [Promethearchaeota archaeon]
MFILGNSFYVIEGSAFLYTNPSTTPLWSYSTGKQYISAVSISDDGSYIAGASEDLVSNIYQDANGKLYVFNNLASEKKAPLWNYSILNGFSSLALSGDGSYLIVGGSHDEHRVFLFNTSYSSPEWSYYTGGRVNDVEITTDGKQAAAACGPVDVAYLFNTSKSSPIMSFFTTGLALRVVLSSNGNYMAVSDNAGLLYFYNTSTTSPQWTYSLSGDMSSALSISGNGNYMVSGGDKIYIFEKNSSTPIWTYQTPDYVTSIKISKDGNYIVAGSRYLDNKLYFFNRNSSITEWIYPAR